MLRRISNVMLIITLSLFIVPMLWTVSLSEIGVSFWLWGIVLSYVAWYILLMSHQASNPKESNGLSFFVGFLILLVMFSSATFILQTGGVIGFALMILSPFIGDELRKRWLQQNNQLTNGL